MFKLRKYFKPFFIPFLICIILLGVQASGELFLPEYMSKMIDVGISQGGIESVVPEVISDTGFNKLMAISKETDRENISDSYYSVSKGEEGFSNNWNSSEVSNVFVLKKITDEDKEILINSISKPLAIISYMQFNDNADILNGKSAEETKVIVDKMESQFDEADSSKLKTGIITYIKYEYEKIGYDVEKLQQDYTLKIGGIMLLVSLGIMVVVVFETLLAARIAAGIGRILRKEIFNKVVGFSNAEFDKFSTASLITRSTNDVSQIQNITVMLIRAAIYSPILATGGLIKIVNSDASMTWIIGLAVLVIIVMLVVVFVFAVPKFKVIQTLVDKINLVMRESLTGMLVVRTFGTQDYELEKFGVANTNLQNTNLFIGRIMTTLMPVMMLTVNIVSLLILWVGGNNIEKGSMQIGDMMAFIQYAMQIIFSFLMFSFLGMLLPRASVAAKRIYDVLSSETLVSDLDSNKIEKFDDSIKGEIVFKNVSFKYPNAEEYVIEDISFSAKAGETIAFIGGTGSGKSTITNLIPRFYDVTQGEIIIDGKNIANVSQKDLRDKIGYIPQKSSLFSGTIKSNIKFSSQNITDAEMEKAAEISQALEFINSKPETYNEPISQGATNISGGQKQRLSIARAIAKKPEIFIFDDSFSALDYKTDSKLRKAITENLSKSTILIIGQRISTIKSANQIIVLDDGKIVGKGKHEQLLTDCDVYRQIALSQLSKEELFNE